MTVSESALLCTSESLSFFFGFCFVFFFRVRFCTTVRCVHSEQKKIIREILNDKSMRHREVYSKFYLRGERQSIRLLCLRETNT